MLAYTKVV